MNEFQKAFLQGGFALLHCNINVEDIYDKNDIYSNKAEFKNMIKDCYRLHEDNMELDEILLKQYEFQKNDTLIIIAKLLEKVSIKINGNKKEYTATPSKMNQRNKIAFVFIDVDYNNKIESIEMSFEREIIDSIEVKVKFEKAVEIIKPIVIPVIETSFALGESLINIKFKNTDVNHDSLEIELYDNNKDLLGIFTPKKGMFFTAITDLAFDKYSYKIIAKKGELIVAKSEETTFELKRPNYGGKPTR